MAEQDGPVTAGETHPDPADSGTETVEPMPATVTDPTGHPAVDAVLDALSGLDDVPVEQHVAAFTSAHEALRAALEQTDDADTAPGPGTAEAPASGERG